MPSPSSEFEQLADPFRRELLVHCYRMLGSFHDAEDVVQETYLRAWRAYDRFEHRASVRTWLYRIATRACLTALENKGRRVLPSGLGGASDDWQIPLAERRHEVPWLEPLPDAAVHDETDDPAAVAVRRETTRLAFIAALQQLPAKQRAVLILREVLEWPAAEVAELLDTTVAAVNSALQRARAQLAGTGAAEEEIVMTADVDAEVLDRFVTAFEKADVALLTELLRRDVELEMPPIPTWFSGRDAVAGFYGNRIFAAATYRHFVRMRANGCPATAAYQLADDGLLHAHSIQVLELVGGEIAHVYAFLDPGLFACFGLPPVWER
ncbi:MAG: polymerase sigma-70 factor, subfamily [Pseudonocardiales bacterium]|nr:polymerase sigma-70 factor, subfamily [Pseudonocardiales bacterium]